MNLHTVLWSKANLVIKFYMVTDSLFYCISIKIKFNDLMYAHGCVCVCSQMCAYVQM